jgi:hypothetical protein
MLIDRWSEACAIHNKITSELNSRFYHEVWMIITADEIPFALVMIVQSVPISVQCVIIPMPNYLSKSRSEEVIISCPWLTCI